MHNERSLSAPRPRNPPKRWRRRLLYLAVVLLVALLGGELFARFYLGLGNPPLSMDDADTKYLFQPDQDGYRFGNHYHYNHWSMRSAEFPKHKNDKNEFRVLVVGDSIVNGGVLTDQAQLATEILQRDLARDLRRPVVVGNISAGSWQPPSMFGYLKKFGLFDADVLVLVISSHDYSEVLPPYPPAAGVRSDLPDHKPMLALQEAITRYLLPRIFPGRAVNDAGPLPAGPGAVDPKQIAWAQESLRGLIESAQREHVTVIVVQYPEATEINGPLMPGYAVNRQTLIDAKMVPVDLRPIFSAAMQKGEQPYRDPIHPNAKGQQLLAETLRKEIESAVTP